MRRSVVIALLTAVLATIAVYWFATRTIVVGRAVWIDAPPPLPPPHVPMIGKSAPGFENLRGRVVVVSVWASWCQPCTRELPRIEKEIWQRFRPKIEVIGVGLGENAEKVREFNRKAGLTFQLLPDPDKKISHGFDADHTIPQIFVIDRSGTVVYEAVGYDAAHFDRIATAVERAINRG